MEKIRILVDCMGGDNSPNAQVLGALKAKKRSDIELILVGNKDEIEKIMKNVSDVNTDGIEIIDTDDVITMCDDPMSITKGHKSSSMSLALHALAEDKADAVVSSGNTGALFLGGSLIVRKPKGVSRAAIGVMMPFEHPCMLIDSGANINVTEDYLLHFAVMGSDYMKHYFGIENPRVGLLNNGLEESKGTPLYQSAHQVLRDCPFINFVGNVEPDRITKNACDVVVCDGFTGNILLKSYEGAMKMVMGDLKNIFAHGLISKLSGLMIKKKLMGIKKQYDPRELGGSPILGLKKTVIKAHGSSDAKAFCNAILQAEKQVRENIPERIAEGAERFSMAQKQIKKEQKTTESAFVSEEQGREEQDKREKAEV